MWRVFILGACTRYCLLSSPKRAECLRVCFHCLSGIVIVTLNRSYSIPTYMLDAWRSWQTFLERFWLRWFSPLCTHLGQVHWHNASLVFNTFKPWESDYHVKRRTYQVSQVIHGQSKPVTFLVVLENSLEILIPDCVPEMFLIKWWIGLAMVLFPHLPGLIRNS